MEDRLAAVRVLPPIAFLLALFASAAAGAQALSVLPVIVEMGPRQVASVLTIVDQGEVETSFQVRAFAWSQSEEQPDRLSATDELMVSPPLGTIPAGHTQVVRLVLRRPPQGREGTYRVLLDQIPPPPAPGTVRIALRLSIPVFAEPETRATPHLQWRVEARGGESYLLAVNDGNRHQTVRDITLRSPAGNLLKVEANVSPYVLAGATRCWRIAMPAAALAPGTALRLKANADTGAVDRPVAVGVGQ